jgi:hypothetical protein
MNGQFLTVLQSYFLFRVQSYYKIPVFPKKSLSLQAQIKMRRNEDEENVADCPPDAAMFISIRAIAEREPAER